MGSTWWCNLRSRAFQGCHTLLLVLLSDPASLTPLVLGAGSASHLLKNPCFKFCFSREAGLGQAPADGIGESLERTRKTEACFGSLSPKTSLFHFHPQFICNIQRLFGCLISPCREKQLRCDVLTAWWLSFHPLIALLLWLDISRGATVWQGRTGPRNRAQCEGLSQHPMLGP